MSLEYEYQYYKHDKSQIIPLLKSIGAKKKGAFLFRVMVFKHPLNEPNTYLRVRDEGHRITMTHKTNTNKEFPNENEIIINDFDQGCQILLGIGAIQLFYYEKIREIWDHKDAEIVFDTAPGRPEIMEIESPTKAKLNKIAVKLGLEPRSDPPVDLYKETYNITLNNISLTFKNAKKELLKLVKKNRPELIRLLKEHNDVYKKLMKSKTK